MPWLKENYEKASLTIALILLAVIVSLCFFGDNMGANVKPIRVSSDNSIDESLLSDMAKINEVRKNPANIRPRLEGTRKVNLFIGPNLYMKEESEEPIDIYTGTNVHPGIPNEWWRKYNIDIGYANSPERDEDKDGFTNREEFDKQTNPSDVNDHPSLLEKITGKSINVFKIQMRWSRFDEKSITIYYQDTKPTRVFGERVFHDTVFYENRGERFKLSEKPSFMKDPQGRDQEFYEVEDRTLRYKNTPKQFFKLFRKGAMKGGFNEIQDRSVVLQLNALGRQNETFEVREFEKFSLPYDPNSKDKPFQISKIEPLAGQTNNYEVVITENAADKPNTITLIVRK